MGDDCSNVLSVIESLNLSESHIEESSIVDETFQLQMSLGILEKMISDDDSISFEENNSLNIEISEMV